jgi:excisionase family DNA binding protein
MAERQKPRKPAPSQPPLDLAHETPLRVEEAAKLFGVHRRTIANWFARGLPYVQIGRIRYTTREAIARFAEPGNCDSIHEADADTIRRSREAREFMRERFGF